MKDNEDNDPFEDACEDDKEPNDDEDDIDNVEADNTLSCDSNWVMDLMASVSCWSNICLVSWILSRSENYKFGSYEFEKSFLGF